MRKTVVYINLLLFSVLAVSFSTGYAQDPFASVQGKITDSAGRPLSGAGIWVAEIKNGTNTDRDGNYSVTLPPGTYHLIISLAGREEQKREIIVPDDGILREDFTLIIKKISMNG